MECPPPSPAVLLLVNVRERKPTQKKKYVEKCETTFNLRLNNHIFQRDAKFVLGEQITKKYNTIEELRLILKKRENFWILNLRTLYPDDLNEELSDVL